MKRPWRMENYRLGFGPFEKKCLSFVTHLWSLLQVLSQPYPYETVLQIATSYKATLHIQK